MYIHHKAVAAFYKLIIGALALALEWYLFSQFGSATFRLFPAWVLILTAVYYLVSALNLALAHKKISGKNPAPVFEGMIIIGYVLMIAVAILSVQHHFFLPHLETWLVWMLCFFLPVLTFLDWLLFVKKGRWRAMAPLYWLAFPVCYVATMIFTAEFMPNNSELIYPLEILDYYNFGLWNFLEWSLTASVGILLAGYILYLLDFIISGKLAKNIVLPHIQVIEVEEEVIVEQAKPKGNGKPSSVKHDSASSTIKNAKHSSSKAHDQLRSSRKSSSSTKREG